MSSAFWMPVYFFVVCQILEFVIAETSVNLALNGNFEELAGNYPAGIVVTRSTESRDGVVAHWDVKEGAVEIISSRFWQSSTSESLYAVHLNSKAGPGAIQTNVSFPSGSGAKYRLAFDMAGSPYGGPSLKSLEVDLSNESGCHLKKLTFGLARGSDAKRLGWKTVQTVFDVHGSGRNALLKFRSLTPGPYGPLIDNVRLVRLCPDDLSPRHPDRYSSEVASSGKTSRIELLFERLGFMNWIHQHFLRRSDL